MKKDLLLNIVAFLSAFLLFQIELIVAKIMLPNYGGSYMVWGACMVFFQAVLLLGYLFSHLVITRVGIVRYRAVHLLLLLVPLLFFPGRPLTVGLPTAGIPLSLDVFWQLLLTIGPVFFALSTIGVSTQVWLSGSQLPQRTNPYALYGWSNLGSFAGLFSFPFVVEYFFTIPQQLLTWKVLYLFLIAVNLAAYLSIPMTRQNVSSAPAGRIPKNDITQWFLLSVGAVMMFLSTTNIMTMEIAPVPVLWVIPLGIYLLAFVLNFKKDPWCPAWISEHIHTTIGFGVLFFFLPLQRSLPILLQMVVLNFLLFMLAMYCQNRLMNLRPRDDANMTFFYLVIAFGGFVGGVLTSWVIPLVSVSLTEYLAGLTVISLALTEEENAVTRFRAVRYLVYFVLMMFVWPMMFPQYHVWGLIVILSFFYIAFTVFRSCRQAVTLVLLVVIMLSPYLEMSWADRVFIYRKRNFYGTYKIYREPGFTILSHGTIIHGSQFQDKGLAKVPTTYFGESSPAGKVLLSPEFNFVDIGIVGLGAGTLAAYLKEGQTLDFYELDPDVLAISQKYFTYTSGAAGKINYIMGDARRSLAGNNGKRYDIFIVDAFSGDSVPVHLLTKEMMELYRQHLTEHGVLLIHVSNRYLGLSVVAERSGRAASAKTCYSASKDPKWWEAGSEWVAVTWNDAEFEKLTGRLNWQIRGIDPQVPVWSDEYSNITALFKPDYLIGTMKSFTPFNW